MDGLPWPLRAPPVADLRAAVSLADRAHPFAGYFLGGCGGGGGGLWGASFAGFAAAWAGDDADCAADFVAAGGAVNFVMPGAGGDGDFGAAAGVLAAGVGAGAGAVRA